MRHDFGNGGPSDTKYDSQGRWCTRINGVMDYGARRNVDKFSTCSNEDFARWHGRVMSTYGSFCMTCGEFEIIFKIFSDSVSRILEFI